jgi:RHS repeat-associated protein
VLYAGYRLDPESGLYQVRFRHYHPTLGRWVQRDPIGYHDGMAFYEYAISSPTISTDPSGQTISHTLGEPETTPWSKQKLPVNARGIPTHALTVPWQYDVSCKCTCDPAGAMWRVDCHVIFRAWIYINWYELTEPLPGSPGVSWVPDARVLGILGHEQQHVLQMNEAVQWGTTKAYTDAGYGMFQWGERTCKDTKVKQAVKDLEEAGVRAFKGHIGHSPPAPGEAATGPVPGGTAKFPGVTDPLDPLPGTGGDPGVHERAGGHWEPPEYGKVPSQFSSIREQLFPR